MASDLLRIQLDPMKINNFPKIIHATATVKEVP